MKTKITLQGCDDSTEIVLSLSDEELLFLKSLAALFHAKSTYACKPRLLLKPVKEEEEE